MSRAQRAAVGVMAVVAAAVLGACGTDGDEFVVWDLRSPATARDLGGRGTVISHEGADRYTVRLPDREIDGAFRAIDGLADPARAADHGGAIDTLTLRFPFATDPDVVAEQIADVRSLFDIAPPDDAVLAEFVERVRASAAGNEGRIDVADFEPGTTRARTSAFAIADESGLGAELLVSTMDADTMALTLMIEFEPGSTAN